MYFGAFHQIFKLGLMPCLQMNDLELFDSIKSIELVCSRTHEKHYITLTPVMLCSCILSLITSDSYSEFYFKSCDWKFTEVTTLAFKINYLSFFKKKTLFCPLNFYTILQTSSNFEISHFKTLNFQFLSLWTPLSDFKCYIMFIPLIFV